MTSNRCINGNLDGANYSSPMPFIGLYIAAASLVCILMMLYDIVSGICAQQRWLPCKAFSLDSVTLTLLSIATKIPVDLTTTMPSTMDQLSKLCGTTLVCISIGFMYPSLAVLSPSESFSNMVSLTIFILTIVVNICIQLYTGVIILFFVEHVIILSCMIMLLLMCWLSYWLIDAQRTSFATLRSTSEEGSVFTWLKNSYRFLSLKNPQILACMEQTCVAIAIMCSLSSIILIQAAVRSLVLQQLRLCSGFSAYTWSVSVIVVSQTLLVMVGTLAICSRIVAFSKLLIWDNMTYVILKRDIYRKIKENPILGIRSSFDEYSMFLKHYLLKTLGMVRSTITFLPRHVISFWQGENALDRIKEWIEQKRTEDLERWRGTDTNESATPLSTLLSTSYPPQKFPLELSRQSMHDYDLVGVNSLSIVVLVRIAQACLSDNLSGILVQAFIEVKEILHYIDKHIRPGTEGNHKLLVLARAVWEGADFTRLLSKPLDKTTFGSSPDDDLRVAIHIIQKLRSEMPFDEVGHEVSRVAYMILYNQPYSSIEDLGSNMQHLFVAMLRMMLAQLPTVICKRISDSPAVEYEERMKVACQYLYKVEPMEECIQWEWPEGYTFSSLMKEEIKFDETERVFAPEEGNVSIEDSIVDDLTNSFPIVCAHDGDVIVEVE